MIYFWKEKRIDHRKQEEASWKIQYERSWIDALFLNQGKYVEEILKRFDMLGCKSHGYQPKNVIWWIIIVIGYDLVQIDYWAINVSDEYKAIYLLCFQDLKVNI